MKKKYREQLDPIVKSLTNFKDLLQAAFDEINDKEGEPTSKEEDELGELESDIDNLDTAVSALEEMSA